jgi:hypothetical protein
MLLRTVGLGVLVASLLACTPRSALTPDNLVAGARAETFVLSHGALCARLPTVEAIELYANDKIPTNSAMARDVRAWDLSGLLDIVKSADGRWLVLPSVGLKGLEGVHFKQSASGENDALCFGRLWVERFLSDQKNQPFGVPGAVTARFYARIKEDGVLRHFKHLKLESFNSSVFVLETGTALGETLQEGFVMDMTLRPTHSGWYLAKGGAASQATAK